MAAKEGVCVLGVFAADLTFRAARQPRIGETVLASGFALGPGGKGSNQAVAAAKLGMRTTFITRLGDDEFAALAERTWHEAGVEPAVERIAESHTGAAGIFVDETTGDNAIVVAPGAAGMLDAAAIDAKRDAIAEAAVFLVQLEQPLDAAMRALALAREHSVTTILNPAPAAALDDGLLALCDWLTPNESEAETLTGVKVEDDASACEAATALRSRGVGNVAVTLGERGVMLATQDGFERIDAFRAGDVVETVGAGDAFNGGFAVGLAEDTAPQDAARFGCAVAGISVTRHGAAASMPDRATVEALLKG